jgi:hypothetical protein
LGRARAILPVSFLIRSTPVCVGSVRIAFDLGERDEESGLKRVLMDREDETGRITQIDLGHTGAESERQRTERESNGRELAGRGNGDMGKRIVWRFIADKLDLPSALAIVASGVVAH